MAYAAALPLKRDLTQTIEHLAAQVDRVRLVAAAQAVSQRYRREGASRGLQLQSEIEAIAYACARMPATFAAVSHVLDRLADAAPATLLDVGAGPGTATLAAQARWPEASALLVEPNTHMRRVAQHCIEGAQFASGLSPADLVMAAYVLNEVDDPLAMAALLWANTQQHLVLIDTGTPAVNAMMLKVRDYLLALGAHIAAPCPHALACPFTLGEAEGWCHFSVRLERTKLHKALKGGQLGYEDEKFFYLVFSRQPVVHTASRIVGHPRIAKVVDMLLCQPDGHLHRAAIAKSNPRYREAKKADWGDLF